MDAWKYDGGTQPGADVRLYPAGESSHRGSGCGRGGATPDQATYLLGPEDAIEISVWKEPDLTKQLVVRPDGKDYLPLNRGGSGLRAHRQATARKKILKRLEKFVTDAHVTVILLKAQNYKVYVTGKVNKPGDFLTGTARQCDAGHLHGGRPDALCLAGRPIMVIRSEGGKEEVFPLQL